MENLLIEVTPSRWVGGPHAGSTLTLAHEKSIWERSSKAEAGSLLHRGQIPIKNELAAALRRANKIAFS